MRSVLVANAVALVVALFGTPLYIRFLVKRGYGQFIRDDGPTAHHTKRGTPTMGGIVIIISVVLAYFLAHLLTWTPITASALLVLYLFVGHGVRGFMDDWAKISKQRSLGLTGRAKLIGQAFLAGLAGGFGRGFSANTNSTLTGTTVNVNGQRQKLGTGEILEGGLGEGVATSADMVSKYLIERAEQYQPVIEMPTGIDVEIVFLEGVFING